MLDNEDLMELGVILGLSRKRGSGETVRGTVEGNVGGGKRVRGRIM